MFCSSVNFSKWPQQTGYSLQTCSCNVCAWLPDTLFWVIHSEHKYGTKKVEGVVCSSHLTCLKSLIKHTQPEGEMWCFLHATEQKNLIPKLTQSIFRSVMLRVHDSGHQPAYSKHIHSVVRHIPVEVSTTAHSTLTNHPIADCLIAL